MRHLWQKIFAFTLVLVIVSQVTVLLLHHSVSSDEAQVYVAASTNTMVSALEGQSLETAKVVADLFNRRGDRRIWIESSEDRSVLAGERPMTAYSFDTTTSTTWKDSTLRIADTGFSKTRFIVSSPLKLKDGTVNLFASFGEPRRKLLWDMFYQGLIALTIICAIVSFWIAWRVSKPLRTLRREVLDITAGNLDHKVTVKGQGEIQDVALAINQMASSLSRHIRGMRELVANISHELRSPLARITVSVALIEEHLARLQEMRTEHLALLSSLGVREKVPGSDKINVQTDPITQAERHLERVIEELEHMDGLIGTTLLSSKLDLQDKQPLTARVDLSSLCSEMCRRQETLMHKRNLNFLVDIEPDITITGDENLLCNLVSNLLDNAGKYTDENGQVTLKLTSTRTQAVLSVENTHEPLSQEALDHIFEPFHRGGLATGKGAGLGLHLVSQISDRHQGAVKAENTAAGFCFTVTIPKG